jgi:hypothetical protein
MRCVRRPIVRVGWKCAAYDGNAPRTTEILRVRRAIVWRRWKCAAYGSSLSASDGNALHTTEILRIRRSIVWRRWKCAAYDGPLDGGMTTIPPSGEPSFGDDGDALSSPAHWPLRRVKRCMRRAVVHVGGTRAAHESPSPCTLTRSVLPPVESSPGQPQLPARERPSPSPSRRPAGASKERRALRGAPSAPRRPPRSPRPTPSPRKSVHPPDRGRPSPE